MKKKQLFLTFANQFLRFNMFFCNTKWSDMPYENGTARKMLGN